MIRCYRYAALLRAGTMPTPAPEKHKTRLQIYMAALAPIQSIQSQVTSSL